MSSQAERGILFYSHTRIVSGAERVLLAAMSIAREAGYEAVLACPVQGVGTLDALARQRGIGVAEVPALQAQFSSSLLATLRSMGSFFSVIVAFRRLVRQMRPALVHANSVRAGIVATCATVGIGTRVLWYIQDDLPAHPASGVIRRLAYAVRRVSLVAVSASTARTFAGRLDFGPRLRVLHNAVDLSRFPMRTNPPDANAQTIRDEFGIAPGTPLVVVAGMLHPRKGLGPLFTAFAQVVEVHPTAVLAVVGGALFAGDDRYAASLREHPVALGLAHSIRFLGPRDDLPAILRAADVLVHNAAVEPFGLVLIEAMASGTPVVAARVGGIPEIVEDGVTGRLVPPGDLTALAAALLESLADRAASERMAAKGRAAVERRFSLEHYTCGLRQLYADLLRAPARTAVFHDNFCQMGGAERVAEAIHHAMQRRGPVDLHTTLAAHEILTPGLRHASIRTTWMQRLPARAKLFRAYFLLYPGAVEGADMGGYDLIVSSCFGYAKGLRRRTQGRPALHICYCHTPMRWVWRRGDYLARERNAGLKALLLRLPLGWLGRWEMRAARRPDLYLANSHVVADRLRTAFGVEAQVLPPPIDTRRFAPEPGHEDDAPEDFYLVLSRLVPYKRFDLAVEACVRLGRRLVVLGDGPDRARLERLAGGSSWIEFKGRLPDAEVAWHARRTRALLFPGEEDFGMTPLEVNAAGRPVVAFRAGGATETVIEGLNGVFFAEPTVSSLTEAILRLEAVPWDAARIRAHASRYDSAVFERRLLATVSRELAAHGMCGQCAPEAA